jgi:autotransporter-associated beta strand protein
VIQTLEQRLLLATHTWIGNVNNNWSNAGNWTGGAPTSGEPGGTLIVFNSTDSTVIQNIASLKVDKITFAAGSAITLTLQQDLTLDGSVSPINIEQDSNANSIIPDGTHHLILAGASSVVNVTTGTLSLTTDISGAFGLTKDGPGTLSISGNDTYTLTTTVRNGLLSLDQIATKTSIPADLTIGDNTGSASTAVVRAHQAEHIANSANVTINADGLLDLNGNAETINALDVTGGRVETGAGILNLAGNITSGASTNVATIVGRLSLSNFPHVTVADGAAVPDLNITAAISGTGFIKDGPGTLRLSGASANTYFGLTTIADGVLELQKTPGTTALNYDVLVGDGTGNDTLRLLADNQILDTATLAIAPKGACDLNGHTETVGNVNGNGPVNLGGGSLTFGQNNASQTYGSFFNGAGTVTKVGTGEFTIANSYDNPDLNLVVSGAGSRFTLNNSLAHFKSLSLLNGGTFSLVPAPDAANPRVLYAAMSIDAASVLDMNNNAVIWDYTGTTPIGTVRARLQSGFAAGAWNGLGIRSSSAASNSAASIGYMESSALVGPGGGAYLGQTVDATAIMLRYTLAGDADLNRAVGFTDLVHLAQNYNTAGRFWSDGDFNYDGNVDFNDLVKLAQNYNTALPAAAAAAGTAAPASLPAPPSRSPFAARPRLRARFA